jgi:hypothetical protein
MCYTIVIHFKHYWKELGQGLQSRKVGQMFNMSRAKSGKLKSQKSSQSHGRTGRGGRQPPQFVGQTKAVGQYIRFTVGQYLLIIKTTGTNYVNFVVNLVMYGKCV